MEEAETRQQESELTNKLLGGAALLAIPGAGIIAGMMSRKEFKDPLGSFAFCGVLEYLKFQAYAHYLGRLSTYFY